MSIIDPPSKFDGIFFSLSWLGLSALLLPIVNMPAAYLAYLPVDGFHTRNIITTFLLIFVSGLTFLDDYLLIYAPLLLLWPAAVLRVPAVERSYRNLALTIALLSVPLSLLNILDPGPLYREFRHLPEASPLMLGYLLAVKTIFLGLLLFLPRFVLKPLRKA